jgi:hypothetical protein
MEEGIAVAVGGRAGASGVVDGIEKYRGGATANMHAGEMWVAREGWARGEGSKRLAPAVHTHCHAKNTKQKATRYLHTHHK